MSFEDADSNNCNPNYELEDARAKGYRTNCQTCVVAYELRRRGYNVEALPRENNNVSMDALSIDPDRAWIDPTTKNKPVSLEKSFSDGYSCQEWLQEYVEPGKRYNFRYSWKDREGKEGGHILTVFKESMWDGIKLYDPQTARINNARNFDWGIIDVEYPIGILRVDNLEVNQNVIKNILKSKD